MLIVPVLDLCKGVVVHAVKGNRNEYQAVNSVLSSSPEPLEVINDFLKIFNFQAIYIADLDALEQNSNNLNVIESIVNAHPNLEIWLDTGFPLIEHYLKKFSSSKLRLILSSETLPSGATISSLTNDNPQHQFILSLDYKNNKLLGPADILNHKRDWPKEIIILNLDSVGAKHGYQFPAELNQIELTKSFNTYYGGGIRDLEDINNLKSLKVAGALVSTALHNQEITSQDILSISQSP